MVLVPAEGLGLLTVLLLALLAGFGVTFAILFGVIYAILWIFEQIARKKKQPTLYRGTLKRVGSLHLTENRENLLVNSLVVIVVISLVGGGIALVLAIILIIKGYREGASQIRNVLAVIGVLVGISTFFLAGFKSYLKAKTNKRPTDTQTRQQSERERPKLQAEPQAKVYEAQRNQQESERERLKHQQFSI